ncbi:PilN domain-containing protein [Aggregicoccus sp. 17bor-14]|uniref:PilN domain-containing protein n=1 Tax=Myxococcaceae TaxID=31 RepID=UPI00129CE134|nr:MULTISPECIES: PilN domain-containing protein [Myxococcaceae]MBF5044246.1 PilN domain-containing protein [Simulacricoccus sp. 17bor-14]MRI89996.1 PilN domain-containing protein [Aggregicoccus sp. 17bor-14]
MMIRINLLPVRAVKKREMGRQLLVLFAVVLVGAGVFNYLWLSNREAEQARNAQRIADTNAKIANLEKVIGEVKNINARKAEVERKLAVLDDLRKGRSGPVRMLDALASAMPKKVWLKSFAEANNNVAITASAASHDDVAEFMRGLGNVVWTPKGMGRLVEQRRDTNTSRVESLSGDASVEEFPSADVKPFFTNVELGSAQQMGNAAGSQVDFNLTLAASYAL